MKIYKLFFFAATLFLLSCNSDDETTDTSNSADARTYFPLTANSYWTYNNMDEQQGATRDSLYVTGTQMENSQTYTTMDAEIPVSGFMVNLLAENNTRTTETQLLINGTLGAPVEGLPEITIPLTDFILFDTSQEASSSNSLNEISGTIEQVVDELPLTIEYTVNSYNISLPEENSDPNSNIIMSIKSSIVVNIAVLANIEFNGSNLQVPLLASQDVLIATNTYGENVGLSNSVVDVQYELEDFGGFEIELPIEDSIDVTSTQTIDTFSIGQ